MDPVASCPQCHSAVWPPQVYKVARVKNAERYYALAWICDHCNHSGRTVAQHERWVEYQESWANTQETADRDLRMASIEVDAIESAGDLVTLWKSHGPPIREAVMNKCGCPQCRRRLYG